jgi:hypothetical protein
VLKSAHLVYYKFWGKHLDGILELVGPDCGNLKYLSQNQIGPLDLHPLLFVEEVFLVCDEYEIVYKDLCLYKEEKDECGGVVVTGQPGIGMLLSPTLAPSLTQLPIQERPASYTISYSAS